MPLCYRPLDSRKQNISVDIPGQTEKQELVLNDVVLVDISAVENALRAVKSPWKLGYAATIHSLQGLTISDTIVWMVENSIEWSNLVYLAVSRVQRINQLRRIVLDYSDATISDIVNDDIIRKNYLVINNKTKKIIENLTLMLNV